MFVIIIIWLCITSLLSFFIDYTEMNDPADQVLDDNFDNDEPEDIYITMDPHVFIPPPDTYKHKRTEDK